MTLDQPSPAVQGKRAIAAQMARNGARVTLMSQLTSLPRKHCHTIYQQATGKTSPPGQTPHDPGYFLTTPDHRRQGAALLLLFHAYRSTVPPSNDAYAISLTLAYNHYLTLLPPGSPPLVSMERADLLVGRGFGRIWREIPNSPTSCYAENNLRLSRCRVCNVAHLARAEQVTFKCGCDAN